MVEGPIQIWMAYKEPENKNILWLRPFLDKEGYELMFYGATGWTPLCCYDIAGKPPIEDNPIDECG